jgi:hypothetical protein
MKFWEELVAYIPIYDMDSIENDTSHNSFIVAYVFVATVTFLPNHFLTSIRVVYRAFAW